MMQKLKILVLLLLGSVQLVFAQSKTLHLHNPEIYKSAKNNTIWPLFQKEFSKKE